MNHYENSETSGLSFQQQVGEPQASAAGIGQVVMSFNCLRMAIWKAFNTVQSVAPFVREVELGTFEFRERVDLLSFVVRVLSPVINFNVGTDDAVESWKIIAAQCLRSEELWAEVILFDGSELKWDPLEGAEDVQPIRPRDWDGARLLDIADFIATASTYVGEFFLVMDVRAPVNIQRHAARRGFTRSRGDRQRGAKRRRGTRHRKV